MDTVRAEPSALGKTVVVLSLIAVLGLIGWGMTSCVRVMEDYRCRETAAPMGLEGEVKWGLVCYVKIGDRWIPKDQVIYDLGGKGFQKSESE